jgi:hypothetical protein
MVKGLLKIMGVKYRILGMLLVLCSCQRQEQKPANILSQDEMIKVLSEIYVTEEKVSRLGLTVDSTAKVFNYLQDKIFAETSVPDSVFKQSLNYYIDHPGEMEKVYSALVDSLQLREQRASSPSSAAK